MVETALPRYSEVYRTALQGYGNGQWHLLSPRRRNAESAYRRPLVSHRFARITHQRPLQGRRNGNGTRRRKLDANESLQTLNADGRIGTGREKLLVVKNFWQGGATHTR
jgi:hypothetical protein